MFLDSTDGNLCSNGFLSLLFLYAGLVVTFFCITLVLVLSLGFNKIQRQKILAETPDTSNMLKLGSAPQPTK